MRFIDILADFDHNLAQDPPVDECVTKLAQHLARRALAATGWNYQGAADLMGIKRTTLVMRCRGWGWSAEVFARRNGVQWPPEGGEAVAAATEVQADA